MIPFDKVSAGVTRFIVDEMIPHMVSGNPFFAGMASYIISERSPAMLKSMLDNPLLRASGIVDENGNVDIDLLHSAATKSIAENKECVIDLPFGTVKLKAADIEKLSKLCRGTGETI